MTQHGAFCKPHVAQRRRIGESIGGEPTLRRIASAPRARQVHAAQLVGPNVSFSDISSNRPKVTLDEQGAA
jgi:hypothetical protein